jgi:prephenate dehydratase
MRIAIQGEAGSFSHEAALRIAPGCTPVSCARSAAVFDQLGQRRVAAAVIPIENSLAGPVTEHFDLLLARPVFIEREFLLRIRHNLIAAPGVRFSELRRVLSHPVALAQCRDFLQRHPQLDAEPFYDTAGSVKHVVESQLRDAAGIAGPQAAREYHARILKAGIEDDKRNFTRFFLIRRCPAGKSPRIPAGANKTSLAFLLKDVPGALWHALAPFAVRGIGLSKIESRPVRGRPWQYVFFADFLCDDRRLAREALRHLEGIAERVKVLGIYPAA